MLHAFACFLGSLLLFSLEPMLGKAMTPRFGGGAQVWMTCMLFFQATLLLGYGWAFGVVRRLAPRRQVQVHAGLLGAALLLLLVQGLRGLPLLPFWRQPASGTANPWQLLWVLATSAGPVLVALAATAPLLQTWFTQDRPGRSPYRLYAASNLGSLLGLLCYPFLVEPWLGLPAQAWVAAAGFAGYAAVTLHLGRRNPLRPALAILPAPALTGSQVLPWLLASMAGVLLLMSATNHLIVHAAAAPLIWVGPLALYLLTFTLVFEGRPFWEDPRAGYLWMALLGLCALTLVRLAPSHFGLVLVADHGVVFFGGLLCHGFLHRQRPAPASLTGYYLVLAAGGVLGGLLVALVAPMVFDRQYEYGLGVALAALVGTWALTRAQGLWRRLAWIPGLATLAVGGWMVWSVAATPGIFWRDYYGVVRVAQMGPLRTLMNGKIIHGLFDPAEPRKALSYYSPDTGAARALGVLRSRKGPLRVGVLGMGIGTLGLYAQAGDAWTFYEISPAVIKVAGTQGALFPIVHDMPVAAEVLQGDGRRLLEMDRLAGRPKAFDLLVVDAFTNDVVPWHLLTLEALDLYLYHLAADGVLALHLTNPMPLDRVVLALARARNLSGGLHVRNQGVFANYALLARNPAPLNDPAVLESLVVGFGPQVFAGNRPQSKALLPFASDRPWTDERSALSTLLFRESAFKQAW